MLARRAVDLYFSLTLGLALAFNLVAVWGSRWLPMGDVGGWIELIDVVARYNDPQTLYARHYVLPAGLEPNSLGLYVGACLAKVMPADAAARALVSFYVVGTPLAVLMMCGAFDRSRWLAIFACPMVFNALFNVGVLNFLVAFPLVFLGIALSRVYRRTLRRDRAIALAVVFVALYYAHVLAFLIALGLAGLLLAIDLRSVRDLRRFLPLAPSLVLFAAWVGRKYVYGEATEAGRTMVSGKGLALEFQRFDVRLEQLHSWGMQFFRDKTDEWAVLVLGLSWLVLIALATAPRRTRQGDRELELVTLACVAAFFVLPSHMREIELIAERLVVPIALLSAIWPRVALEPIRAGKWLPSHGLMIPVIATALFYPWAVHRKFREFDRAYVGSLPEMIERLPPRSRVAYVMLEREIALTYMGPHWHLPKALVAVKNGGVTDDSFAVRPYCAVQFQRGRSPEPLPERFWDSPRLRGFDYVLVFGPSLPSEALRQPTVRLLSSSGAWSLFAVVRGAA